MCKGGRRAGADWVVLCDTNGGTLPDEVFDIVRQTAQACPEVQLGIHCHNDSGVAVANSLAAIHAGARQLQGTLNGLGEQCGNADLITLIPNLMLKLGFETSINEAKLSRLTSLSRMLDDRLNRTPNQHAPYVGEAAFAGAVCTPLLPRKTRTYEHVPA